MERMCSLDFPPFSVISRVLQKIQREKVQGAIVVPKWPTQTWGPVLMQIVTDNHANPPPKQKNAADFSWKPSKDSPPIPQTGTVDVPLVRRSLESQGISAEASRLIIQSWRSDNASQYQTYYKKWEMFCRQRNINPLQATLQNGINFLAETFDWRWLKPLERIYGRFPLVDPSSRYAGVRNLGETLYREKTVYSTTHKTAINRPMGHTGET